MRGPFLRRERDDGFVLSEGRIASIIEAGKADDMPMPEDYMLRGRAATRDIRVEPLQFKLRADWGG